MNAEYNKYLQAQEIKRLFELACTDEGCELIGEFMTSNEEIIVNPKFQYDSISRAMLLEVKDISQVNYWRSVDNKNIVLNNAEKNLLYDTLRFNYFTKFAQSRYEIDSL